MDRLGLDRISNLLTEFLDVQSRRAQIVASNLANVDTPGYAAQELDFTDYLKQAAQEALTPSQDGLLTKSPQVVYQTSQAAGLDGNNVDSGKEMASLSEAGMQYLTGTTMLQSRLRTLRAAIREGR